MLWLLAKGHPCSINLVPGLVPRNYGPFFKIYMQYGLRKYNEHRKTYPSYLSLLELMMDGLYLLSATKFCLNMCGGLN